MNRNRKGFTLIELLVVIAIIGILATISLVSLNSSTQAADDGKIKVEVSQVKALALDAYIDNNNSYIATCNDGDTDDEEGDVDKLLKDGTSYEELSDGDDLLGADAVKKYICVDSAVAYVVAKSLSGNAAWYCVDSEGTSDVIEGSGTLAGTDIKCSDLE